MYICVLYTVKTIVNDGDCIKNFSNYDFKKKSFYMVRSIESGYDTCAMLTVLGSYIFRNMTDST